MIRLLDSMIACDSSAGWRAGAVALGPVRAAQPRVRQPHRGAAEDDQRQADQRDGGDLRVALRRDLEAISKASRTYSDDDRRGPSAAQSGYSPDFLPSKWSLKYLTSFFEFFRRNGFFEVLRHDARGVALRDFGFGI